MVTGFLGICIVVLWAPQNSEETDRSTFYLGLLACILATLLQACDNFFCGMLKEVHYSVIQLYLGMVGLVMSLLILFVITASNSFIYAEFYTAG